MLKQPRVRILFAVVVVLSFFGPRRAPSAPAAERAPDLATLTKISRRLAPVDLGADISKLPPSERKALRGLVRAAQLMDSLFLRQAWVGNTDTLLQLATDKSALGRARLHAFLQNKGPWLRLENDRPLLPGLGDKPPAGTFFPPDATKQEVETWMKGLPPAAQAAAGGFFTTIRRAPDRTLQIVPYAVEYQTELGRVAALLRQAAAVTQQPTLRVFLEKRATAFVTNDYYDSDVAWMKIDASIEPTIGPYEVYEDGWFSAKAAFEAFVTVVDEGETAKLARLGESLQDIEDHLPIDARLRRPKLGGLAPIRVVNSIFSAGDGNRGVQTAAFNLPNDEKIGQEMGTKRTMLKNVQEAKFKVVLLPISRLALAPAEQRRVSFDAFFTHILMHELMHGLGPQQVAVTGSAAPAGKLVTVRAALQEAYGALEEAKADIAGLFALQYLIDKGILDRKLEDTMYATFLASTFRSLRFGLKEAHGKGIALQLCTMLDAGAFGVSRDGRFTVDAAKAKEAARALTGEIMTIEATGDKARAMEVLRTRAVIRPEVQRVLDRLAAVPVDIEPRFVTADQLLAADGDGDVHVGN